MTAQEEKSAINGGLVGFVVGALAAMILAIFVAKPTYLSTGYSRGIHDYRSGKINYQVITTPQGSDTTYIYHGN